jgi:hypothetical protein
VTSPPLQVPVTRPPLVETLSFTGRGPAVVAGAALLVVGAALLVDGVADDVTASVLTPLSVKGSPTRPAAPKPTPTAAAAKTAHTATRASRRSMPSVCGQSAGAGLSGS